MGRARALADILNTPDKAEYFSVLTKNGKEVRIRTSNDIISETSVGFKSNATKADVAMSNLTTKFSLAGLNKNNIATYVPVNTCEKIFIKGHKFVEADLKKNATYLMYTGNSVIRFTLANGVIVDKKNLLKSAFDDKFISGIQGSEFSVGNGVTQTVTELNVNQQYEKYFFLISSDYPIENFEAGKTFADFVLYSDKNKGEIYNISQDIGKKGQYIEIGSLKGFVYLKDDIVAKMKAKQITTDIIFANIVTGERYPIGEFYISLLENYSLHGSDKPSYVKGVYPVVSVIRNNIIFTGFEIRVSTGNYNSTAYLLEKSWGYLVERSGKIKIINKKSIRAPGAPVSYRDKDTLYSYLYLCYTEQSSNWAIIMNPLKSNGRNIIFGFGEKYTFIRNNTDDDIALTIQSSTVTGSYKNRFYDTPRQRLYPENEIRINGKTYNRATGKFSDGTLLTNKTFKITEERSKAVADFWKSQGYKS